MDFSIREGQRSSAAWPARERPVRQVMAAMRALFRTGYCSLQVEGSEHVPRDGSVVFVQNHAGWMALDAFFVAFAVAEAAGIHRTPWFPAHDSLMRLPLLGPLCRQLGALPVSALRDPSQLPSELTSFGIFPEGVQGNCKPFWNAYRMRRWRRGFARLAVARQAAIVPVAVIGAEECLPVACTVQFLEPLVGSILGCPIVPFPLPSRWKVIFHPPVQVTGHGRGGLADAAYCAELTRQVRATVQRTLDRETAGHRLAQIARWVDRLGQALPFTERQDPEQPSPPRPAAEPAILRSTAARLRIQAVPRT